MKQISTLVRVKRKLLIVHACESAESSQFSLDKFSKSEVERDLTYLKPDFLVHLTNARPKDLEEVSDNRIPVTCCPRANSILRLGFPPILELLDADVTVALGTDNVFREMEFTSRMLRGIRREAGAITSKTILRMATVNGAKTLGLGTETGSIEQGKRADLNSPNLAYSKDVIGSLVHRARQKDVKCVMEDGEMAYGAIPST